MTPSSNWQICRLSSGVVAGEKTRDLILHRFSVEQRSGWRVLADSIHSKWEISKRFKLEQ